MPTYPQQAALDWDNIASTTLSEMSSEITKQTLDDHPVLPYLTKNKKFSGIGRNQIEVRLAIGRNPSVQYIAAIDSPIELVDSSVATVATFSPAYLIGVVKYNDEEKVMNSGESQLIDLLDLKIQQLTDSANEVLSENLYGDGSNFSTLGLGAFVPLTTGSNTVGGISEATAPFWKSFFRASCGSWALNGFLGSSNDYVLNAVLTCSDGKYRPDLFVCDQNVFEYWHRSLGQKVQYTSNDSFGSIGKQSSRGTVLGIDLVMDKLCDANTLFVLHSDSFQFYVTEGMNMSVSPMRHLERQPWVSYQVLMLRHQLVVKRRQLLGRLYGWSA